MKIACLHTAESNVAVFDAAAMALGIPTGGLHHEVRGDLLAAAERAGGLRDEIAQATQQALLALAPGADAVLLTCSTLGPAVDALAHAATPILRTDAALAAAAATTAQAGGKIVALCAVETTLGPTAHLFEQAAQATGATVEVQLVPGAWALFKAGDIEGYLRILAKAADSAYAQGASVVALAQASMSGAAALVTAGARPLSSPGAGLAAAVGAVDVAARQSGPGAGA